MAPRMGRTPTSPGPSGDRRHPGPRPAWEVGGEPGPLVAVAPHAGHDVRPEVQRRLAVSPEERLKEEDPYTDRWVHGVGHVAIPVFRSRFEVDLNRPRDQAVYRRPDDAWGIQVWREPPDPGIVARSLDLYDTFYRRLDRILTESRHRFGWFVVFDLHSYNHRRSGPDGPPADPRENPVVNIGTDGTHDRWMPFVDRLEGSLSRHRVDGAPLDARRDVRFQGGYLAHWVNRRHGEHGCCVALDVKKVFMDEHTGERDPAVEGEMGAALAAAASEAVMAVAA